MAKGEIYPQKVKVDDLSGFIKRNALNDSCNYLHDTWRWDKERFYDRIYYSIPLSLTILAYLSFSWISIVLLTLVVIFLIISAKRYVQQKKRFGENRECMKKSFEEWGLEWRD